MRFQSTANFLPVISLVWNTQCSLCRNKTQGECRQHVYALMCLIIYCSIISVGQHRLTEGLQLIYARAAIVPSIRHYSMILSRETKLASTKPITPLHPTNSLWQFLTLFDSHEFSPEKNYQGLTVIIHGCPLGFSPSVQVFCLLSQFHNHAGLFLGREGGPGRKPTARVRERPALLFMSLCLQT